MSNVQVRAGKLFKSWREVCLPSLVPLVHIHTPSPLPLNVHSQGFSG